MKASEARGMALLSKEEVSVTHVLKLIKQAAQKGEMSVYVYSSLDENQVLKLKALDYQVEELNDKNETFWRVSWMEIQGRDVYTCRS
jgi:hypothetical protein